MNVGCLDLPAKHNLKSSTKRKAIDSSNDWLLTSPSAQTGKSTQWMSHQAWVHITFPAPDPAQLDQVLASTEALLAGTCYDSTSQIVFLVEPVKDLTQFLVSREWDAVHLLLAIDCDEEDIVGRVREENVRGRRRRGLRLESRHRDGSDDVQLPSMMV